MTDVGRRRFLSVVPAAALIPVVIQTQQTAALEGFPRHPPELAREIVGVSHRNLGRVKELVSAQPALARAAWDWGFGDWETPLGAASHVGNKEIAAVLLAAGAHPTIFSAAMLGQLETVRAFIIAAPGIQKTRGPHGITLIAHARAGASAGVVSYLESLGDADPRYPAEPLSEADGDGLLGTYVFGPTATDRIIVSRNSRGALVVNREGETNQNLLFHHGHRVFNPSGAEAVRIHFEPVSGRATTVVIADGPLQMRATR